MLNFMIMSEEQLNEELERIERELEKPISNVIKFAYERRREDVLFEFKRREIIERRVK